MTEPRRVSALTLADRVATERGELVGETVGVSIRFVDKCTDETRIKVKKLIFLKNETKKKKTKLI